MTKAVIFDKDGVLSDSEKLKARAWQETLAHFGVQKGFDWYLKNLGPTDVALAARAIETWNLSGDPVQIAQLWSASFRARADQAEPVQANLDVVRALSGRYKVAVASSMDRASIEHEIRRFGVWECITACVSGEDVTRNKPAPDVYLAAAGSALGVGPECCIAIEDSPAGIQAAKSAGMYCIGYKNPLYDLDLTQADEITADLAAVDFEARFSRLRIA